MNHLTLMPTSLRLLYLVAVFAAASGVAFFDVPLMNSTAYAQASPELGLNAQLLVAARNGDLVTVKRVLDQGAKPNSRNRSGILRS